MAALLGLGLLAGSVQAALNAVDPGPYTAATAGYPAWFQDTHGRALDLCLSKAVSSRVAGTPDAPSYMCSLLPEPGLDLSQPLVLPGNFPGETFWFTGDAFIQDAATGIDLGYISALEAAFAAEEPIDGDQVGFARIRIRVDVPVAGTYIVTHPYGVEVFNVDAPGTRAINMTRDIGIGAPGVFTGALKGDIGPFLRSVNGPYTETNPDTGASETFIGDPNLEEEVTGSPFGTNYVRIQGPNGIDLRTNLFAVSGKLSSVQLPTPLLVNRSTYARSGSVVQQDVFVQAPPPPGKASFVDTAGAPAVEMSEATATGNWYGQSTSTPTPGANVSITADNSVAIATSTPTTRVSPLVDHVSISRAEYSLSSGQLVIEARSSDETVLPSLNATATSSGAAIGALGGAGVVKSLSASISPIPPAKVTVTSASGGSDTEEVVILP
jgi:hypothetical protein